MLFLTLFFDVRDLRAVPATLVRRARRTWLVEKLRRGSRHYNAINHSHDDVRKALTRCGKFTKGAVERATPKRDVNMSARRDVARTGQPKSEPRWSRLTWP
jgi:hypothetical protein